MIGARMKNPVRPPEPSSDTAGQKSCVHLPLGVARAYRRENLEIRLVEKIGRLLLQLDLSSCFDPSHLVHHGRAIDHFHIRNVGLDFLPVRRAYTVPLKSHSPAR